MLDKAHHLMQLFSLRRLKSEVEVSLPPKHELKISVPLSEFQVHFYRGLLMKDVGLLQAAAAQNEASSSSSSSGAAGGGEDDSLVLKTGDDQDIGGGAGGAAGGDAGSEGGPGQTSEWKRLQSLMMQLRKCCDHPYLFSGADPHPETIDESIVTASNKMVSVVLLILYHMFVHIYVVSVFFFKLCSTNLALTLPLLLPNTGAPRPPAAQIARRRAPGAHLLAVHFHA